MFSPVLFVSSPENRANQRASKLKHLHIDFNSNGTINTLNQNKLKNIKTSKCQDPRCLACNFIDTSEIIISNTTYTQYSTNYDQSKTLNCKSKNIIYCITCAKCGIQYIGQTSQKLSYRFSQHKNNVINKRENSHLVNHFNKTNHTHEDMKIRILHNICTNRQSLNDMELIWIKLLNTAHPFGMNEHVKDIGFMTKNIIPKLTADNSPYFKFKTKRRNHGKRKKRHRSKVCNPNVLTDLTTCINNNESYKMYTFLKNCSKRTLHYALQEVEKSYDYDTKLVITAFLLNYYKPKPTDNRQKLYITIPYKNSNIDQLKFNKWINLDYSQELLQPKEEYKIITTYSYNKTIGQQLFNYNKFLKSLSQDTTANTINCNCNKKPNYIDQNHGHIITGDTTICDDDELRTILNKGMKHRLPLSTTDKELLETIGNSLDIFYTKYKTKYKYTTANVELHKLWILSKISIEQGRHKNMQHQTKSSLDLNRNMNKIKKEYIITPVDKATSNPCFMCKRYYFQVIENEIGINNPNNTTYLHTNDSSDKIINHHTLLHKKYHVPITAQNLTLPILFPIPKLHKNPYKMRFIAGAHNSSLKPLSKVLLNCLRHLQTHFKAYCKKAEYCSNRKLYIAINNSTEVVDFIEKYKITPQTGSSYDFSTLYTELNHDVVQKYLYKIVDLLLKDNRQYLITPYDKYGNTTYSDQYVEHKNKICLSKVDIKDLINVILSNTYVTFKNATYKQVKGIPMGGNASPLIADLTLASMEYEYLQKHKIKPQTALFRYMDDILAINLDFDIHRNNMYDDSLKLNKETMINTGINYLNVQILQNINSVKIYDKREAFPFKSKRFFCKDSCMHTKVMTGCIIGQLLSFTRLVSKLAYWINAAKKIYIVLLENNYSTADITGFFCKFYAKYNNKVWKYNIKTKREFLQVLARIKP